LIPRGTPCAWATTGIARATPNATTLNILIETASFWGVRPSGGAQWWRLEGNVRSQLTGARSKRAPRAEQLCAPVRTHRRVPKRQGLRRPASHVSMTPGHHDATRPTDAHHLGALAKFERTLIRSRTGVVPRRGACASGDQRGTGARRWRSRRRGDAHVRDRPRERVPLTVVGCPIVPGSNPGRRRTIQATPRVQVQQRRRLRSRIVELYSMGSYSTYARRTPAVPGGLLHGLSWIDPLDRFPPPVGGASSTDPRPD
jgi:hypothetical protein